MEKTFRLWDKGQREVIEVTAKKVGSQWMAICPKHEDIKPSLSIEEEKEVFHCFGCEWSGKTLQTDQHPEESTRNNGVNHKKDIEATYNYTDEKGHLLYQVIRQKGKRFCQRRPDGQDGWIYKLQGIRRVLYNLPEIARDSRKDETIFVVEGEKDSDNLKSLGFLSTTNSGGAGKWQNDFNKCFAGREVVIIPDNDPQGKAHAEKVAKSLSNCATSIKILDLPGIPEKGDVSDWLEKGGTKEGLLSLVQQTTTYEPENIPGVNEECTEADKSTLNDSDSKAAKLINVAINAPHLDFFLDETNELWVTIERRGHKECYAIFSENFKNECRRLYMAYHNSVIGNDSLQIALDNIKAVLQGKDDLPSKTTHLRVGCREDSIYYDLANSEWEVISIDREGWRIINESPLLFKRFPHMKKQVSPVQADKNTVKQILDFVNIESENLRLLVEVWTVALFLSEIAHPVLVLYGSQGSGKTFFAKLIKNLCDPSVCGILSLGNDNNEIIQSLSHHYFNPFDNLSGLSKEVSDLLCRAVTGEGFSKRKLYTDDEDVIYTYKRPISLNGINNIVTKPDLLDRSILIECQRISPDKMQRESRILSEFEKRKPAILGGIFTIISEVLKLYPSFTFNEDLPRMADFYCYGYVIAEVLKIGGEKFKAAYNENIASQDREVINGDFLGTALMDFMEKQEEWEGTASELLTGLGEIAEASKIDKRFSGWPKTPQYLSKSLNILKVNFEKVGITIDSGHWRGNEKIIKIFNDDRRKKNEDLKRKAEEEKEKLAKESEEFRKNPEPGYDDLG